jgi:hypothetical protein
LVGFKSIFLFVFGGVGLGLIIFTFRTPKEKDLSDPKYRDTPWLANDKWQTVVIKSNSRIAMWAGWGFAAFWNLISAPLPFVKWRCGQAGDLPRSGIWSRRRCHSLSTPR